MKVELSKPQLRLISSILEQAWQDEESNVIPDADRQVEIIETKMVVDELIKGVK